MSVNQLTSLPENIDQLSELRDLGLLNNQIKTLPTSMINMTNLEYMELWDNPLPKNLSREIGFEDIRKYFDSLR